MYYLFLQCNTPQLCLELEAAIEASGGLPYGAKVALGLFGSAMVLVLGGGGAYLTYKIIQCRRAPPTPTDPEVGGPPPPPVAAEDDQEGQQGAAPQPPPEVAAPPPPPPPPEDVAARLQALEEEEDEENRGFFSRLFNQ